MGHKAFPHPWLEKIFVAGVVLGASFLSAPSHAAGTQTPLARQVAVPIAGPDTWGAVDALDRVLPDYRDVGAPKPNKMVGIFYFTANNEPGYKILNNAAILAKDSSAIIGPLYSQHWWGKPLFGFYISSDPFVLREDTAMLGDAGINTVIFDNTNGPTYFNSVQKSLIKIWLRMKTLGNPVPDFTCFAGHGAWNTDYKNIYEPGLAKKLWFYWDGKPLMLIHGNMHTLPAAIKRKFQHKAVRRTAISGCKINAFCVLSAASFWWLHGRHGAGVLGAGLLPPVPATAAPMPAAAGYSCTAACPS